RPRPHRHRPHHRVFAHGDLSGFRQGEVCTLPQRDSAVQLRNNTAYGRNLLRPLPADVPLRTLAQSAAGFNQGAINCARTWGEIILSVRGKARVPRTTITHLAAGSP